MARPLRLNLTGAWYHVMARGIDGAALWKTQRDRRHFLERLAQLPERFRIRVHAYVLMTGHYHLQLETSDANLSRAMHWLNLSYSAWYNVKHRRVGPLFGGRFKALMTESGDWTHEVNRYIHLNPVRTSQLGLDKEAQARLQAGMSAPPDPELVKRRVRELRAYPWSSYRAYVGLDRAPDWLTCDVIGRQVGGRDRKRVRSRYRRWVEVKLREGLEEDPWERAAAGLLFGSGEFVEEMRSLLGGDEREQPQLRAIRPRVEWERIREVVEEFKGEGWERFCDRHGDWGRDLALYLGRRWSGLRLRELGACCGGMDYAAVSAAVKRFEGRVADEIELQRAITRCKRKLKIET